MGHEKESTPDASAASIPAVHAVHLLDVLRDFQVDEEQALSGTGLTRQSLSAPGAKVSVQAVGQLLTRGVEMSGRPELGLLLGQRMQASAHGFLGFAVMTSATLGEALELAARYALTRTDALALRVLHEPDAAVLVLEELVDLGAAREHIVLGLLYGIWHIGNALTGTTLGGDIELAMESPSYAEKYLRLVPGTLKFGASRHAVRLAPDALQLPLVMADAASQQLAREQCERELGEIGEGSLLESRVRALIPASESGYRTAEEVARLLGMSVRTLKRRLSDHGLRYSELLDAMRRDRAVSLLREPKLSVDQVAERLGYSDTANFTRAFRRWTGQTPAAFRRTLR